jgi:hypothetical protein
VVGEERKVRERERERERERREGDVGSCLSVFLESEL